MMYKMPEISLSTVFESLKDEPIAILVVANIVAARGKNKGKLRSSKPKFDYAKKNDEDELKAMSAYVWRMVAFYCSPKGQHHCMPVMANYDIPEPKKDGKILTLAHWKDESEEAKKQNKLYRLSLIHI